MNRSTDDLAHAVDIKIVNDLSPALDDLLADRFLCLLGGNATELRQFDAFAIDMDVAGMSVDFDFDVVLLAMLFFVGDSQALANGVVEILSRDPLLFCHLFQCFDKLNVHLYPSSRLLLSSSFGEVKIFAAVRPYVLSP